MLFFKCKKENSEKKLNLRWRDAKSCNGQWKPLTAVGIDTVGLNTIREQDHCKYSNVIQSG